MSQKRHAVRKETVLEVNGIPIGSTFTVEYVKGPPEFGICQKADCDELATEEDLLGLQFCARHFNQSVLDDDE